MLRQDVPLLARSQTLDGNIFVDIANGYSLSTGLGRVYLVTDERYRGDHNIYLTKLVDGVEQKPRRVHYDGDLKRATGVVHFISKAGSVICDAIYDNTAYDYETET